jgi:lipopolysaccharide cholinephosphotransferase
MDDVHQFCVNNGIKYSLAYGSLIGAIRHKGFIPWDDDIDIFMPRQDYERFCATYKSDRFKFICEKTPNYYLNYGRVYEDEKTFVRTRLPFTDDYKGGLWLDVFPMDGAEDDHDKFIERMRILQRNWFLQLRYRNAMGPISNIFKAPNLKDFCILLTLKLFCPLKKKLKEVNNLLRKEAKRYSFGETSHWSDFCCINVKDNNYHLVEEFDKVMETEFEGRLYFILQGFDNVLRRRYNDYMQLPPEYQRKSRHSHVQFYWK